jgi:hypothetical protein
MKSHTSVWRETTSSVLINNSNLAADRRFGHRLAEPLFIGAPTESPSKKNQSFENEIVYLRCDLVGALHH